MCSVERLVLLLMLAAVAVAVALVLQRRRQPTVRPTATGHNVPDHVDRADFDDADALWLVAVFTSATCDSCGAVWDKAQALASNTVAVQEIEYGAHRDLHDRYAITGVPSTLLVDSQGAVRASFIGPVTATDLWATLAELREPGTLPAEGCEHGL